jgi:hypothetical protein
MYSKLATTFLVVAFAAAAATPTFAAVSAPWPPTSAQKTQTAPGYDYAVPKGKSPRTKQAPTIGEAHGSR